MSRFYQDYLQNKGFHKTEMPKFMQDEINNREINKQHIRQADSVTRGKHTGSKSMHKVSFNMHRATSMLKTLLSGYNE